MRRGIWFFLAVAGTALVVGCAGLTEGAKSVRFADSIDQVNGFRHCRELGPVKASMMANIFEAEKAVRNRAAALGVFSQHVVH